MNPQALSVVKVDTKNGVPALFFNINTDGPTYWQYLFGIPASPAPTDSKLKSIWTEVFWKPHKLYGPNGIEFPGETWDLSKEVGLRKRRQVWTHIKNLEAKVKDKIEREGRLVEQLKKAGAATPEPFLKYVAEMRKKGHQIESIYPPHVRATEQRYKSGGGLYKALLPDIREWLSKEKEWPSPLPWQDTGTFGVKKIPNFVADLKGGTTFGEVEGLKVHALARQIAAQLVEGHQLGLDVRPQLLLAAVGLGVFIDTRHARFANANGPAHQSQLVGALDRARLFGQFLSFDELQPSIE